jgi:hypothetical protein
MADKKKGVPNFSFEDLDKVIIECQKARLMLP